MTSFSDLRKELPPSLRGRFDSLGGFVHTVIHEIEDRKQLPAVRRMSADLKQDISMLVFVAVLRQFLIEGTRAATAAAREAVALDFAGFTVGSYLFTPENENTRRGAVLAEALWERIKDQRLRNLLDSEKSLLKLIEELYGVARNPEKLDRYGEATSRPE